jgi:hypothetical protein
MHKLTIRLQSKEIYAQVDSKITEQGYIRMQTLTVTLQSKGIYAHVDSNITEQGNICTC